MTRPRRRAAASVAAAVVVALCAPDAAAASARAGERVPAVGAHAIAADFAGTLAPHGEWLRLRDGALAWRPDGVDPDWHPYRDGEWAHTSDGWFWVSVEPWAWATYHYGTWRFDGAAGWVWLPGSTWAPSRVVWRYGPGVVGWAPDTGGELLLPSHWTFMPAARFAGVRTALAAFPPHRVAALLARTRVFRSAGPQLAAADGHAVDVPAIVRDPRSAAGRVATAAP